ncbi:MAG: YkgJ family cysteine cluster protein [Deltaproteobacteria bacterium]|nr:YkgJ family cysteine cluster protein [Deltaproteobacteria bacterium]
MKSLNSIHDFHLKVDNQVKNLTDNLPSLKCKKGCSSCCIDELTLFTVECDLIENFLKESETKIIPAPSGNCVFLKDGFCQVYEVRPYVCRTQGLPLRWFEDDDSGDEIIEYRDICPENDDVLDIETAESMKLWLIGPFEDELRKIQMEYAGNLNRTPMRHISGF